MEPPYLCRALAVRRGRQFTPNVLIWVRLCGRELTAQINEVTTELTALISVQASALMAIPDAGRSPRRRSWGKQPGWGRFRSKDAYARHNGTALQAQASAARTDDRRGQRGADGSPIV